MTIHPSATHGGGRKDLRRLPHVYSKVLELPLPADADVAAFESPGAFHFVAACGGAGEVRARAVRIHPGVVKVVVVLLAGTGDGAEGDDSGGMVLDRWRSRLPEASCPAMAVAGYVDGHLVVTVPKASGGGGDGTLRCCNGGAEISPSIVAVQ